jgi:hypothetical protein
VSSKNSKMWKKKRIIHETDERALQRSVDCLQQLPKLDIFMYGNLPALKSTVHIFPGEDVIDFNTVIPNYSSPTTTAVDLTSNSAFKKGAPAGYSSITLGIYYLGPVTGC